MLAYGDELREEAKALVDRMEGAAAAASGSVFVPDIHRVERWWDAPVLGALGRAAAVLRAARPATPRGAIDLGSIAFCRALIETTNVSFGHQSISFLKGERAVRRGAGRRVGQALREGFESVAASEAAGARFTQVRKRTSSKRELYEYLVEATLPLGRVPNGPASAKKARTRPAVRNDG